MGVFTGRQMMARDIVMLCRDAGWRHGDLIKMVATGLGESNGYVAAWNENKTDGGTLLSKDIGLFQISVLAENLNPVLEQKLCDPTYNVQRARALFEDRHFQPWVAYTSGWVTFPEWWVWTLAEPHHWVPTGRFLHRALRGWVNSLVLHLGHKVESAIYYGNMRADDYKIKGRFVPGAKPSAAPVDWADVPAKPTEPPLDGVGPRPTPNKGDR